ncbi:MAG: ribonuclease P protein component [Bacteroidales bacterium]|jgi:ribonuclease P protein component|nr:ribonuclease P protein component [Bacteroidales bacterium]
MNKEQNIIQQGDKKFGFSKREKICKRNDFLLLFQTNQVLYSYPYFCRYRLTESKEQKVRIAISAPKKYFKRAVDRNRIKRLTREIFRLNKHILYQQDKFKNYQLDIFFIYSEEVLLSFDVLQKKMLTLLNKLSTDIQIDKE